MLPAAKHDGVQTPPPMRSPAEPRQAKPAPGTHVALRADRQLKGPPRCFCLLPALEGRHHAPYQRALERMV